MTGNRNELLKDSRLLNTYRGLIRVASPNLEKEEVQLLRKAFLLSADACLNRQKKLGELTIYHSLGVARIVAEEMGLGLHSIVSALLFDFISDGTIKSSDIKTDFPGRIIDIIEGLSKISGIDTYKSDNQGEKLRSLLVTLSADIRVILVKLADRVYYMRNLDRLDRGEQLRITSEILYIYAPLAHRLGLYNIKTEMEDLALKFTDHKSYRFVAVKLKETKASRDRFIRDFIKPLKDELNAQGIEAEITGRTKSIHSIWSKMKRQNVDFEEIYDLFAIRIIIKSQPKNEKADCWKVYSIVTDFYQPNPNRLRDWISIPKSNAYEALHTTVVVPGGRWVEVQIRTERMDEIAEKGLAAHWKYKGGEGERALEQWFIKIREVLENPEPDASDIIDDFKISLYNKEIFVFTPKGDLKKFPAGATVLDFAFDVHSDIGASCVGAKVNGKSAPIRYIMNNGDKVEIITSKSQKPKQDWLQFVVTTKARTKIRQALQEQKLAQAESGKEILKRRFRNWKIEFEDQNINTVIRHYKLKTATDLYFKIATDKIDPLDIKELLTSKEQTGEIKQVEKIDEQLIDKIVSPGLKHDDYLVIDNKLDKMVYRLAKCCNPIYGDEIFGFVTVGEGITIHRISCPNAARLISKYGYRVVKAQWSDTEKQVYLPATIRITGIDDIGILSRISDVISQDLKVNMRSVQVSSDEGMFEGTITLFVKDTSHLDVLIRRISKIKGVLHVSRLEL
ncbi:MAG: MFS transporter [Bacteroides sp. SM23_62_1]|nr:MAG: MFS transporter [Bacteroides sp. SM23_62_1]